MDSIGLFIDVAQELERVCRAPAEDSVYFANDWPILRDRGEIPTP